jgi:DNA-binding response OmpR family regulator
MRILLVEDNARLRAVISQAFTGNGFAVDTAECAADAEAAIEVIPYLAVILDLGLPDRDGMTVLSFIRDKGLTMPVFVLASRDGADPPMLNGKTRWKTYFLAKSSRRPVL